MTASGRRQRELSLWPLGLVLLVGALLVGGAIFAASFIGGTTNGAPAASANPTLPPIVPAAYGPTYTALGSLLNDDSFATPVGAPGGLNMASSIP